jgi:gamma-glutamyltranspeptidase/glutathione hydrolase
MKTSSADTPHARGVGVRNVVARFLLALVIGAAVVPAAQAQERPGPDDGAAHRIAVATAHERATEAGIAVLRRGGTAADASIAIAAMLTVVEPWFSSVLGGGTWALYYDASSGQVTSLDAVGPVGGRATIEDFASRAGEPGLHQTIVPGAWSGWIRWSERYGRLDLPSLLEPAIDVARAGYPVYPAMRFWIERDAEEILAQAAARAIYAPDGTLLDVGDTVVHDDLADTLETISSAYRDALEASGSRSAALVAAHDHVYRGPVARAVVTASDAGGGYLELGDFEAFEARIVEPLSVPFGTDLEVFQNPPNSQGITMLIALRILDRLGIEDLVEDDVLSVHYQIEATKLAFEDRHLYVGDPDRVVVPVAELLSQEHAERQARRIDPTTVLTWPFVDAPEDATAHADGLTTVRTGATDAWAPPRGTTTFHVVDAYGNAAAVTTSLGAQFRVVPGTGIHLNNRMRFMSTDPRDPNHVAPGATVRHTSNPYLVLRDGVPYILGGNTGADTQPQAQVQQFVRVAVHGAAASDALAAPRWVSTAFPSTLYPYEVENTLQVEPSMPLALQWRLARLGHELEVGQGIYGVGAMIVLDEGDIDAAVDPRYGTASWIVESVEPD